MGTTSKQLLEAMDKYNACQEAQEWVENTKLKTASAIWNSCPRGDWLLWFAARAGVDRKVLVRAACKCAREALKFVAKGEARPLRAIETAERWCDGEATINEVKDAADAAYAAAADYAAYAAAADAAYAAAADYAAYAAADYADYAAYAAADAADAAYAAAADYAAYAAADYAAYARKKSLRRSAKLVRQIITWAAVEEALRS